MWWTQLIFAVIEVFKKGIKLYHFGIPFQQLKDKNENGIIWAREVQARTHTSNGREGMVTMFCMCNLHHSLILYAATSTFYHIHKSLVITYKYYIYLYGILRKKITLTYQNDLLYTQHD